MVHYQHALNCWRLQIGSVPDFASDFVRQAQRKLLMVSGVSKSFKVFNLARNTRMPGCIALRSA